MISHCCRIKLARICLLLAGMSLLVGKAEAQTNYYGTNGVEYAPIGSLVGDQAKPDLAIRANGGFMVWQDNVTDGDGLGISARRLDPTLSGTLGTFRVNADGFGNQENPRVGLLKNGGTVFVWEGGKSGFQHIYARFMNASNTFLSGSDVMVNTPTNRFQSNPSLAVLNNSNVVFVWTSRNQQSSNSLQDIYGQIFSTTGQKIGTEFLINQFTSFNQRNPAVAPLANGGFVVTWVSEQQRVVTGNPGTNFILATAVSSPSVDLYARLYNSAGTASGGEFLVNTGSSPCASPAIAPLTDGGFMIAWTARDLGNLTNGWDVYSRYFNSAAVGGLVKMINTNRFADQISPRIASIGSVNLIVWNSEFQDGSGQGVYGRFIQNDGNFVGSEFRINTTTLSQQLQPVVASDAANRFLVVWTSFTGLPNTMDLMAQRYINTTAPLQPLGAPYVWAPFVVSNGVYQPRLLVSWPFIQGLAVSNYSVYVNGALSSTATVTSNQWTMTSANGLAASSTACFQIDYLTTDGRRAAVSPSACGSTWNGLNWGGIPFEWLTQYFGSDISQWPAANSKLPGGNLTVYKAFISGSDPLNPSTWLKQQLIKTAQGLFLSWNTQPGATYQVQASTNFITWSNVGSPRFAAGTNDSIFVGGGTSAFYQVILMR